MFHWGIIIAVVTFTVVAGSQDFTLNDKWVKVIHNPETRNFWRGNLTWNVQAHSGSTIKIYCTDFRLPIGDVNCEHYKVTFDDGLKKQEFCDTHWDFQIFGKTSKMTIDLTTSSGVGAGFLECLAKAVHAPRSVENVDITLGSGIMQIVYPQETRHDNDKAWRFRSTTDDKISLQCDTSLESAMGSTGECVKDILTIDAGDGAQRSCGGGKVVVISKGKEITMRLETFPETEGRIKCLVQGISGPDPNEHKNVKFTEEDSSEFGVSPGRKRTTCACGSANRDSGRIINGTEVQNESKYPFLVSMRDTTDFHFCGASILTPLHILTAAHCVSDRWTKSQPDPSGLRPTVGVHKRSEDASHGQTKRLRVKEVHIPQEWFAVKGSLAGDIAILVLESPIRFSKWISPVCLTSVEPPVINKLIKAMGWGRTEKGSPETLMESNVQVLDKALCNNDPREVCFKSGRSSTCFGDSGGPYVHVDPETNRYTQVALVSYGFGQCEGSYFIGTNVVHWYKWIQNIIAATSGGHGICQKIE